MHGKLLKARRMTIEILKWDVIYLYNRFFGQSQSPLFDFTKTGGFNNVIDSLNHYKSPKEWRNSRSTKTQNFERLKK